MKAKSGRFQRNSRIETRRMAVLMGVALIALVAGIIAMVKIVRLPALAPRAVPADPGALSLAYTGDKKRNHFLEEEASLLDPTPLFLPTQHSYTQTDPRSLARREPDQAFDAYSARFAYPEANFAIRFSDNITIPAQPLDALAYGQTQTPYATLGRGEFASKPLPPRQGFVEVVHTKTGQILLTLPILRTDPPPAGLPEPLVTGDWSPLEYLAAIDITGLAGAPMLTKGTAPAALVQYLANYIEKDLHLGARRELPPGAYILRVGP